MNAYLYLLFSIFITPCISQDISSQFTYDINRQGVELLEKGQPVFFYQKKPKSSTGKYVCNNYLHPLYSLDGDVLTEEFPLDHPYHRGIFWAWHQIYLNGKSLGDGWIMKNIQQDVVKVQAQKSDSLAHLKLEVLWKSSLFDNGRPFVAESTEITVHPQQNNIRKIDFVIAIKALVPGLEIGGSDDEKGYGGFCARLKLSDDLTFTSSKGRITPEKYQIEAGPWMDFSSSFDAKGKIKGVAILCHPKTPNYPAPWILRSKTSMQNIVFPGRDRFALSMNHPTKLYYRLIIHNGDGNKININKLQYEYDKTALRK